jgi:hypothetical protein
MHNGGIANARGKMRRVWRGPCGYTLLQLPSAVPTVRREPALPEKENGDWSPGTSRGTGSAANAPSVGGAAEVPQNLTAGDLFRFMITHGLSIGAHNLFGQPPQIVVFALDQESRMTLAKIDRLVRQHATYLWLLASRQGLHNWN